VALDTGTDPHEEISTDLAPFLLIEVLDVEGQLPNLMENCVLKQAGLRSVPLLEPALAPLIRRNVCLHDPPRFFFLQELFFLVELVAFPVAFEFVSLIFGVAKRKAFAYVAESASDDTLFVRLFIKLVAHPGNFMMENWRVRLRYLINFVLIFFGFSLAKLLFKAVGLGGQRDRNLLSLVAR